VICMVLDLKKKAILYVVTELLFRNRLTSVLSSRPS
jgi:hypothetical protein